MNRRIRHSLALALATAVFVAAGGALAAERPSERPVVVRISDGGFRWTDAAIGAAGALGVVFLLAGLRLAGVLDLPRFASSRPHAEEE